MHVIEISTFVDVLLAQRCARQFAASMGFSRRAQWEIATAVSEASTNILKYGVRGVVELTAPTDGPGRLEFTAADCGAGIDDPTRALLDGVSQGRDLAKAAPNSRTSLGCGLGAISRLMDGVSVETPAKGGTILRAHKLARRNGPR